MQADQICPKCLARLLGETEKRCPECGFIERDHNIDHEIRDDDKGDIEKIIADKYSAEQFLRFIEKLTDTS